MQAALIIAAVLAVIVTVLIHIFILNRQWAARLGKFGLYMEGFFNFRYLLLEKILRALYILSTMLAIFCGFFLLFCKIPYTNYSTAPIGLGLLILGPIVLRISYEALMLSILKYKALCEINKAVGGAPLASTDLGGGHMDAPARQNQMRPRAQRASSGGSAQGGRAPRYVYCNICGERYDANRGPCPYCNKNRDNYV